MYEHAGDVAADNEAPVMYHRILGSAQYYYPEDSHGNHNHNHDAMQCDLEWYCGFSPLCLYLMVFSHCGVC